MATASASSRAIRAPRIGPNPAPLAALSAIAVAALVIRLTTLTEQSYWLDESYTVHLVRMSLSGTLATIPRTESTPPVYYVVAWLWTHVFGTGEFGLRSLSALAGAGTVLAAGLLAHRLSGERAAVITSGLLTVSPLLVWFSQEARAYALAALLSTLSMLWLLDHARTGRRGPLAGWAIASGLALGTHYFTVFVVLPGALWLLGTRRRRPGVAGALAIVAATALALVPLALAQRGTGHADYIARGALGTRIIQVPKQLLIGYASPGQLAVGIIAAGVLVAGTLPPILRRRPVPPATRLVIAAAATGVLLPILLALIGIDFLDTRNLIATLPLLTALAGAALAAGRPRWSLGFALALGTLSALVVVLVDTHPAYQRTDWRGALQALGPVRAQRVLVIAPGSALLPTQAYEPHTRVLLTSATTQEIDVASVASGPAPAQAPGTLPGVSPPAGFHLVASLVQPTYTVERFWSATPVAVTAAGVGALPVGASRAVLVQGPG